MGTEEPEARAPGKEKDQKELWGREGSGESIEKE
jgi:hypothetical protein